MRMNRAGFLTLVLALGLMSAPAWAQQDVNVVSSVDEPAHHPFQASVSLDFSKSPGTVGSTFGHIFVPAGKRLVIEYVSAGIFLSGTQTDNFIARASLATTIDGKTVTHFFVPVARGTDSDSQFKGVSVGQVTRLYAEGTIEATVIPNHLPNTGAASVSISGYLVDISLVRGQ